MTEFATGGNSMEQLRYVVLHHTGIAEPHYDLMFEHAPGSALETFRTRYWPVRAPADLVPLGDHRRDYLDHEGPVGGGRGEVGRVAAGTFRVVSQSQGRRELMLDDFIKLVFSRPAGASTWRVHREM